jgi:hypothetical protein
MKPQPAGLESFAAVTIDILSGHIDQIEKNCGGIKELAAKVDKLIDIIKSCPHCQKRILDRKG